MVCRCGHPRNIHNNGDCEKCLNCDGRRPYPGKACCLTPKYCPCTDFAEASNRWVEDMEAGAIG